MEDFIALQNLLITAKAMYSNFDHSCSIEPQLMVTPDSLEALISFIKNKPSGLKIRPFGSIHVFNGLSACRDVMVDLSNLDQILTVDHKQKLVTVEAGHRIYSLIEKLADINLALAIVPAISGQSIAGAISTATHGSNFEIGTLASQIISLELVLADGSLITINKGEPLFNSVLVSLGTLGIIYSLTLQCQELYSVEEVFLDNLPWSELSPYLEDLLQHFPLSQFSFDWRNAVCQVTLRRKVSTDTNLPLYYQILTRDWLGSETKQRSISEKRSETKQRSEENQSWKRSAGEEPYSEIEMALDFNSLSDALDAIKKLLNESKNNKLVGDQLLVRFAARDDALLSTAADRDQTAFISLFADARLSRQSKLLILFKEYQDLLLNKFQARPHHGKKTFLNSQKMSLIYPGFEEFLKAKISLDPDNIFSNDYITSLLGK